MQSPACKTTTSRSHESLPASRQQLPVQVVATPDGMAKQGAVRPEKRQLLEAENLQAPASNKRRRVRAIKHYAFRTRWAAAFAVVKSSVLC